MMKTPLSLNPVTRRDLDRLADRNCPCGCGAPINADNPLSIAAHCHFPTACKVEYWDGVLTVTCAQCGSFILQIAVASPPENRN